jgi:lipopolysaccharide biosynthesis regulator YciM
VEIELWWLLVLPLFFGLGWLAARIDIRQLINESRALPRSYFAGLNFLLNEQPDKAIDAFIEVARLDPETTELHFALGSLFRRRGETERAIRVHQNLVNRPDLPATERDHALYELGQDFLRAGLLDRAEESLRMLMEGTFAEPAKRVLLELYEVEKEWRKAIDAARELQTLQGRDYTVQIAQFCCELAQESLQRKDVPTAVEWLERALQENPTNVRATIQLGDVAQGQGDVEGAIKRWRSIEQQNAAFLPLVAERLMKAYLQLGRAAEGLAWLRSKMDARLGPELLDTVYKYELDVHGIDDAVALMRDQIRRQPSLMALTRLVEAEATRASEAVSHEAVATADVAESALADPVEAGANADIQRAQDLGAIRDLLQSRTRNLARYTCQECGFRARLFYWQCPGCNRWETYAPRRTETLGGGGGASM